MDDIVVIGAGQAGASMVARLRKDGFAGRLTLIGEEPVPPYQRPPLSKGYLLGEMALERLFLRPESFYADENIVLRSGQRVDAIDRVAKTVRVDGETIAYDQLALTTGSVPRRLPASIGGDLAGVHVVRTLSDVDAMAPDVTEGARALIVGGGYIGLEAAAVAARLGAEVVLVEAAGRILQRVAAPETSEFFRSLHRGHGVDIREGVGLDRLIGKDGRVSGAVLSDGRELPADFVVVGIGIEPATALAQAAGLDIDNGIAVDVLCRTSDPAIWAAGDCCSFPYRDGRLRLESVPNAIDQAECVAGNMLGAGVAYVPKPWFWSDQYDVKLQIAGLNTGYDRIVTRRGESGAVSFWYFRGDDLLAVDAMNDPRAYMVGKRLIEAGRSADAAVIADGSADLKALLRP
ncbi:NAD(P)/FAD-dependent oxidoreductase [Pukyongiella litopenaei]|uniref:Pyridine nucleotide-disulfide oxidoreductase n=1 Tax=Pukyongiella litopenaei TaxID=2605946 RepID=A0A2S0MSK6_9RHOB|nr:FAD-dependent oxidoreductase [Pukyongiella litopenaei]AVO38870.1 pyridine nucleotide-disulfide oxidoreductase [Pukyongiella litopenaei]